MRKIIQIVILCGLLVMTGCSGRLAFSVGPEQKITFAKGNLQYHPKNNIWQFAANQTDYIGETNSLLSASYDGWVDLFGWSGDTLKIFGVSTSETCGDYGGEFLDWASNPIAEDQSNTWRTLTMDEWNYLCNERLNADSLKGVAQVNGVNGLVLLPDKWDCPRSVSFKPGFCDGLEAETYEQQQTFTTEQWTVLEKAGAVFLPAAGFRRGVEVNYIAEIGSYWSATPFDKDGAYFLDFFSEGAEVCAYDRCLGHSVRLVKDKKKFWPFN